jgi:hypothetical protein
MKGHGEKLSRKQEALISALLTTPTLADAAHTAGIGEVTAWRWLKDATFQATYRDARRAVVQHAIAQVQRATGEAVETLRSVMQDAEAPASARVSAARVVLETAVKAVEVEDLEARITAIEAQGQPLRACLGCALVWLGWKRRRGRWRVDGWRR